MSETVQVTTWWTPGEPEDDLRGFLTVEDRDACESGQAGPFRRVVRDHHKLGPISLEAQATRAYLGGNLAEWVKSIE